ncbi:cyclodeaminase/cyclohydrolase family protein [Picrophilus oshimae]|uniref:Formiminotransferase-cyclodeaminase n=1 Tax=Picrophilus torridus (strain ATCC 700027 / DSM 9790 / JCM 10055 / NBRC 100828 / KAW 2/3) TaxID=1122961 RepID=Q6KZM4_PICTO|nr:cyclodeaminase/cyclohydrolase family protein [Picrophilus oshimae]AAT43828.1 formiminotransferase-cyclodeaminase [Picrophilus oshimae DSM 9789]
MDFEDYISSLKSDSPAPGGGSAAALVAIESSALNIMVSRFSMKKRFKGIEPEIKRIIERSELYINDLYNLRIEDEKTFLNIMNDIKMGVRNSENIIKNLRVSWHLIYISMKNMENSIFLAKYGNKNLISDALSSFYFSFAAAKTSFYNIKENIKAMDNSFEENLKLLVIKDIINDLKLQMCLIEKNLK